MCANIVEYPIPLRSRKDREAGLSGIFTSRGLVKIPDNRIALRSTRFPGKQRMGWFSPNLARMAVALRYTDVSVH